MTELTACWKNDTKIDTKVPAVPHLWIFMVPIPLLAGEKLINTFQLTQAFLPFLTIGSLKLAEMTPLSFGCGMKTSKKLLDLLHILLLFTEIDVASARAAPAFGAVLRWM